MYIIKSNLVSIKSIIENSSNMRIYQKRTISYAYQFGNKNKYAFKIAFRFKSISVPWIYSISTLKHLRCEETSMMFEILMIFHDLFFSILSYYSLQAYWYILLHIFIKWNHKRKNWNHMYIPFVDIFDNRDNREYRYEAKITEKISIDMYWFQINVTSFFPISIALNMVQFFFVINPIDFKYFLQYICISGNIFLHVRIYELQC